jgi:hypothetical protein
MAEKPSTRVVTNPVRLSYVHLFEPYSSDPENAAVYSVTILIPKDDKDTYNKIKKAQKAALDAAIEKGTLKTPKGIKYTMHDGDDEENYDHEKNPEYAGNWVMALRSRQRPGVVDKNLDPITDPELVYSGCWARVSMNFFGYANSGNKGISAGINNVMKVRDDDSLTGRTSAAEDFEDFAGDDVDDEVL